MMIDADSDDRDEQQGHSFVLKIWREGFTPGGSAAWRGQITHVASNDRRLIQHLDEIGEFVAPYLAQLGVRLGPAWRVRRWLRHSRKPFHP